MTSIPNLFLLRELAVPIGIYFKACRLFSPFQRLVHPSQRNFHQKSSREHRALITYALERALHITFIA